MAGALGEGPVLAPTGHSTINEPRVSREALVGTESQAFHDAGSESFDENVRTPHQIERELNASIRFEVNAHRVFAPLHDVMMGILREHSGRWHGSLKTQNCRAEVRKHPP